MLCLGIIIELEAEGSTDLSREGKEVTLSADNDYIMMSKQVQWSLLLCALTSFGHNRGIYTVRTGSVYLSFTQGTTLISIFNKAFEAPETSQKIYLQMTGTCMLAREAMDSRLL